MEEADGDGTGRNRGRARSTENPKLSFASGEQNLTLLLTS